MRGEVVMCELLLVDIDVETLMDKINLEMNHGRKMSCKTYIEQKEPTLRDNWKLGAWKRPKTSGEMQVDRRFCYKQTVVMSTGCHSSSGTLSL